MIKEIEIGILPNLLHDTEALRVAIASHLQVRSQEVNGFEILRRSIDARSRKVLYRLRVRVFVGEEMVREERIRFNYPSVSQAKPAYIIGAGPAGLFAALRLVELGLKPIIFERGKDVKARRRDLAVLNKQGVVNPESNYCFGEGGAGTYSDGKLYTRSTKRGEVNRILQRLIDFGADPDIMINTRPHIGTNKLPQIIEALRERLLSLGGEIHFDAKLTDIEFQSGSLKSFTINNDRYATDHVLLATGHSAHDVYELLHLRGVKLEPKAFALGVRIEHPQEIIDQSQYHCEQRPEELPPAYYSLVEQVEARGVFSFCMCPGGIIAPCATAAEEVVVNGWSPSKRNNPFANSGLVVQVDLADIPNASNPLSALHFQRSVEHAAYLAANRSIKAPAQRIHDFVHATTSSTLPINSYLPGLTSVNLWDVLPSMVSRRLARALPLFDKKIKGYNTQEGILVGVESRTSSAVRIPRNSITLQHVEQQGLFPCAEGAGYAGGIVSAAIDGEKSAEALATFLNG
jgi:hypothetical protein